MFYHIENILYTMLVISLLGFLFSVMKETIDLSKNTITLKSKSITQKVIDEIDMKIFKLGDTRLNIGDEVKIYFHNRKFIKGVLLGANKKDNSVTLVTNTDEVCRFEIKNIRKLRVISKYGRLF